MPSLGGRAELSGTAASCGPDSPPLAGTVKAGVRPRGAQLSRQPAPPIPQPLGSPSRSLCAHHSRC